MTRTDDGTALPEFHLRYGDLLANLTLVCQQGQAEACGLLTEGLDDYLGVASRIAAASVAVGAHSVLETFDRVIPGLPEAARARVERRVEQLKPELARQAAAHQTPAKP